VLERVGGFGLTAMLGEVKGLVVFDAIGGGFEKKG
jgi:hypothetical protein